VNAPANLCPRCGSPLVRQAVAGGAALEAPLFCTGCGDVASATAPDDGLLIGNLGDFAASADEAPALLDDLLLGDSPPVAPPPAMGQPGLDLFLGDLPSAENSPLAPLELDLPGAAPDLSSAPLDLSSAPFDLSGPPLDLGLPAAAAPPMPTPPDPPVLAAADPAAPAADPFAAGGDPMDIGAMFASLLPPGAAPKGDTGTVPSPFQTPLDPPAVGTGGPGDGLLPDLGLSNNAAPEAIPPSPATSGWTLTLNAGTAPPAAPAAPPAAYKAPPLPAPAAAKEGAPNPPVVVAGKSSSTMAAIAAGVPRLEPPRKRGETLTATVEAAPRSKLPFIAAGAGVLVAAGVAAFFLTGKSDVGPEKVLAPFTADLGRDHFPAYLKAAEAIMASSDAKESAAMRARAAELLFTGAVAHGGDKKLILRGNELLVDLAAGAEAPPALARAKALAALARGRGSEAENLVAAQASAPEAALIKGLRKLRERKGAEAVAAFRTFVTAAPDRLVGEYLLGRALEEAQKRDEANAQYRKVLAKNPTHAGALVGQERVTPAAPAARKTAVEALLKKIDKAAAPAELGEAQSLLGEALLALGQTPAAVEALMRAVIAAPGDAGAQVALTEALIAEGRAAEALTRLRGVEPAVLANAKGRLAMGAALLSAGQVAEGSAQIEAAAAELPTSPQAATWQGVAAESRRPPEEALAIRHFREALKRDPRYLPASLRLAALFQRQGKPADALALIKEAESAGAPAEALAVAWGQALIEAKNPGEAESVLRKAIEKSPQLVSARTALAAALEAGGKQGEAEAELGRAIIELPKATGLRQRLAALYAKHGKKEEALATLEKDRAAGQATPGLRVEIAKLALELGQPERAVKELESLVADDPGTPDALFTLGRAREANGDSNGALIEYRRALAFGSSPELHLAYGRVLAATGRDEDALSELGSAGEFATARLERARIRLKRNEVQEALKEAQQAARLAPGEGRAHFLAGICLDLMGRADDAADAWKRAIATTPNLPEAHYRLGRYEMDKGRQTTALAHFRTAAAKPLENVNWEADLQFQLGFAEVASGSRANAVTALRRYLDLAPADAPARPEAERQLSRLTR
jgi:tetratricopeptide (TPR) repeat protein